MARLCDFLIQGIYVLRWKFIELVSSNQIFVQHDAPELWNGCN